MDGSENEVDCQQLEREGVEAGIQWFKGRAWPRAEREARFREAVEKLRAARPELRAAREQAKAYFNAYRTRRTRERTEHYKTLLDAYKERRAKYYGIQNDVMQGMGEMIVPAIQQAANRCAVSDKRLQRFMRKHYTYAIEIIGRTCDKLETENPASYENYLFNQIADGIRELEQPRRKVRVVQGSDERLQQVPDREPTPPSILDVLRRKYGKRSSIYRAAKCFNRPNMTNAKAQVRLGVSNRKIKSLRRKVEAEISESREDFYYGSN